MDGGFLSDRRIAPALAGFAWGVLALLGFEFVVAAKALQRSGGALKAWAAFRGARKSNAAAAAQAAKHVQ